VNTTVVGLALDTAGAECIAFEDGLAFGSSAELQAAAKSIDAHSVKSRRIVFRFMVTAAGGLGFRHG
jgi:hypothetical protein